MKKAAPQQRSVDWFRSRGHIVQTTEQTIRYPDKEHPGRWKVFKRDLFGFCDLVVIPFASQHTGMIFVQVTAGMNNKGERQTKIEHAAATKPLLLAGNTVELHIWRKLKPRGTKVAHWKLARFWARIEGSKLIWEEAHDDEYDFNVQPELFYHHQEAV